MAEAEERGQQQPDDNEDNVAEIQTPDSSKKRPLESRHYSVIGQTMADGRVMIGQDIQIFPGKELSELASPGTKAYEARDRRLPGEQFAVLCGRSSIPRVMMISAYKGLKSKTLLKLVDAGIVNWAPEGRQRLALVFEKPFGKKMLESLEAQPLRVSEERLIPVVIQPVVDALAELKNSDLTHGSLHLGNMFLTVSEGMETVILGDCLSSAPSSWQHHLYETAARAVAKPSGRGPGTVKDDLYALGVCVAMMALGKNFLLGRTAQQLIYDKIEHGSHMALIGHERMPGNISEFIRGVLSDDDDQRWDIDDVSSWLEGRRLAPKQARPILKAARALVFHGHKYLDLRSVAQVFSENTEEAAAEIDKGQFEQWLKRNFEDKKLKLRFDRVWEKEKTMQPEKMLCQVCMALDPFGPVRFKGLSVFPAGFGTAMAVATSNGEDIHVYGEIISQQFFSAWLSQIFEEFPDAAGLTTLFEKCRAALTQKMPGYGMERVLYILNPEVACLSPLLKNHFVLLPGGLLLVLEELSRQAERPAVVLDRHMIAFISVREPKMVDPHLGYLNSFNKGSQVIGIIRTLAAIQRRFATGPVPGVGNWLISLTPPLIEQLHDRDLRQSIGKHVNRLADSGDLMSILEIVDDRLLIQDDIQRFTMARNEYAGLVEEKVNIEDNLRKRKSFGRTMGRQLAMIFSSLLAIFVIAAYVVLRFMRGF